MNRPPALLLWLILLWFPATGAPAQEADTTSSDVTRRPITLRAAIDEALASNPALAIAGAQRDVAEAAGRGAAAPLWPRLGVEAGYLRSVDPVAAFGMKLRQGTFTEADFAVARLTDPDPVDDWYGRVSLDWRVLEPANWADRAAARRRAEAAGWNEHRLREATVLRTRVLYYAALRGAAAEAAARSAEAAARATVDWFRRRHEEGLLTRADLLQSEAELAAAEAERQGAVQALHEARRELGLHLGWEPELLPVPTDSLGPPEPVSEAEFEAEARADLRSLEARGAAARASERRATLSFLPSLNAFAEAALHDAFSSGETDWTVGLVLRWTGFAGFSRFAERDRAGARARAAEVEYSRALREARSELDLAVRAVRIASKQVEASRAARAAASAGRDLMRRRFEEGLVTPAELLQAEARATAMRQREVDALTAYHIAVARLEFVRSQTRAEDQR